MNRHSSPQIVLSAKPRLVLSGREVTRVQSDRVWSLLGLLAITRGHSLGRDEIADRIWPSVPRPAALHRLRQTLIYLRNATAPESIVQATRTQVRLSSEVELILGSPEDFLASLSDHWILAYRDEALAQSEATLQPPTVEALDAIRQSFAGLNCVERDLMARSMTIHWLNRGVLLPPITFLVEESSRRALSNTEKLCLAEMLLSRGESDEAIRQIQSIHRPSLDPLEDARALYLEGLASHLKGWESIAERMYRNALKIANGSDPLVSIKVLWSLCFVSQVRDQPNLFQSTTTQGSEIAERIDDQFRILCFRFIGALALMQSGDVSAGLPRLRALVEPINRSNRPQQAAHILNMIGRSFENNGFDSDAEQAFEYGLNHARQTDNPRLRLSSMTHLADRIMAKGMHPEACALHSQAAELCRAGQGAWALATSLRGLGFGMFELGQTKEAKKVLLEAIELYQQVGQPVDAASAIFCLARIALQSGSRSQAKKLANETERLIGDLTEDQLATRIPKVYVSISALAQFKSLLD